MLPTLQRSRKAATLLELLIVIGIVSIILVSVATLVRVSVDYYFYSSGQIEVQRRSLLSLSLLTQELTYTNFETIVTEDAGPNPGIIFASAVNAQGGFSRDSSGRLEWTKLVCYYVETLNEKPALMRKEDPIAVVTEPPDPQALGRNVAYFRNLPTAGRFMARGVTNLQAEPLTDAIQITITAEVKEGRNWLEMDIDTRIVPRN